MTYGTYARTKPRLNVLRGWPGNETTSLTYSAKPKADEAIKSGMVICLDDNGEWVKATFALSEDKVVYFATADQSDTDVISSGKLLGLSCAGNYELQTCFFDDQVYAEGTPLKVSDAVAGNVEVASITTATDTIIGFCSRGGKTNIASTNSEASGVTYTLNLTTRWIPNRSA